MYLGQVLEEDHYFGPASQLSLTTLHKYYLGPSYPFLRIFSFATECFIKLSMSKYACNVYGQYITVH